MLSNIFITTLNQISGATTPTTTGPASRWLCVRHRLCGTSTYGHEAWERDDQRLSPRRSHAVTTRSRSRRELGFKGKGGVGGARKCDGQLLTALCGGWLDVGETMCRRRE